MYLAPSRTPTQDECQGQPFKFPEKLQSRQDRDRDSNPEHSAQFVHNSWTSFVKTRPSGIDGSERKENDLGTAGRSVFGHVAGRITGEGTGLERTKRHP